MTMKLTCGTVKTDVVCATSGTAIAAGANAASLTTSDGSGSQRATATAILTTYHDPRALLESLTLVLGREMPAGVETGTGTGSGTGTSAKPSTRTTRRTRSTGAATPPICALTGRKISPDDAVVLLPSPRSGCGVLALALPEAAELLAPVLTAVGGASAIASLRGLEDLPEPQRSRARAALEAAAAASCATADGCGDSAATRDKARREGSQEGPIALDGSGAGVGTAAGAGAAAAVDPSSVPLDTAPQQPQQHPRLSEQQLEQGLEGRAAPGAEKGQGGAQERERDLGQPRAKRQRVAITVQQPTSTAAAPAIGEDPAPGAAPGPAAAKPPLPRRGGRRAAWTAEDARAGDGQGEGDGEDGRARARRGGKPAPKSGGSHDGGGGREGKGGKDPDDEDPESKAELDLDRERAERMERNRRMLLELQLPGLVSGLAAAVAVESGHGGGGAAGRRHTSQRGVGAKRSREGSTEAPPPRRVSLRQRGVAADSALVAGIDHETATGVVLAAGRQALEAATQRPAGQLVPEKEKLRHPKGELPFRSDNGDENSDTAFLEVLKRAATAGTGAGAGGEGEGEPGLPGAAGRGSASRQRAGAGFGGGASAEGKLGGKALARLGLQERDVAKVTKDGVTHMAWLPGSERLMLAAADKSGRVSLWDVDEEEGGPASNTDGVLMFAPHSEYVSGMRWLGREAAVGPCRLITVSYDGSLRALDLGGAGTWLELPAPGDPRDAEFSALEVASDGRTAYLGDPLGSFDVVDLRAPQAAATRSTSSLAKAIATRRHQGQEPGDDGAGAVAEAEAQTSEDAVASRGETGSGVSAVAVGPVGGLQICDRKINSLHLEPFNGHLLATSCSDGTVCIWDVRKLETSSATAGSGYGRASGGRSHGHSHGGRKVKPLSVQHHGKSCHAAYWAHDGSRRLLSTSYDDTIRVWSASATTTGGEAGSDFEQALSIRHNNQTGRWITPFRAVWNAACDAVLVGNMRRGLDVFEVGWGPSASAEDTTSPHHHHRKGEAAAAASSPRAKAAGKAGGGGAAGQLLRTLTSDYMTAIPSRAACHPSLPVVVAATSSGRCHVWR